MPQSPRRKSLQRLRAHLPKILAILAGVAVLAGGAYVALKQSPKDHFKAGNTLFQQGDLKGAAIELKNTLQGEPNNAAARVMLGRIHFNNGDFLAAEKEFRKALEIGSKEPALEPLLARTLLHINEPQKLLDEISVREGESAESNAAILALRARAYLMLKNKAAAESELAQAQALSPDHPESLISRAYLALADKKLDEAMMLVERAASKTDGRADIWVMKGDLLRSGTKKTESMQAYAKALAIEPANTAARLASVQLHLEANDLDKAEADLKELRQHAPNNMMGRYLEAFIEFRRGRHAEAKTKLQEVLRTAPTFLPAHLLAGTLNLATGNREAAKSHFDKVLEAAPDHPLARKLMAATLSELGEMAQASKILDSFEGSSGDPVLNALRGKIALRQGRYAEAREHLEAMGDSAPQNAKYFTDLAASRMGSGDEAGAIKALTKAAELDTTSTRPDALLVLSLLKKKRYEEAFKVVDKLDKERPNDPEIHNLRGTIHIARENKIQARASFANALRVNPGYFPAAANLAILDMRDQDTKSARSRFEQLLKSAPAESRAWLALASLDAREKNEAGYLENLEHARKANGKNVQAHLLLSRYWLEKKDGGKALAAAREGLTATGRPEFHELVGLAQLAQQDHASAQSTLKRWADLTPGNPMAHFRLAQAQLAGNNKEAALKSLDRALALRSDFPEAGLSKASVLVQLGRSSDALKLARSMQTSSPKNAAGYLAEAATHFADKKYSDAGKLFAKAAELSGKGQALGLAYQAFAKANQAAEGERLLEQWLKNKPNDAVVRHHLAMAQLNARRLKESADNYRMLIRTNPKDLVALNNLAWSYGELKDARALDIAEQAYKLSPDNPATLDTLGWILVRTGQAQRGRQILENAHKLAPDSAEIHWHLAAALSQSGDRKNALAKLEILLGSGRDFPGQQQALQLYNELKQRP